MKRGFAFKNRTEAGILLGMELESYRFTNPVILAIAGSGVETGHQVALRLGAEFDVTVTRRLTMANHPETTFGAIAEDGSLYLDPRLKWMLTNEEIDTALEREKEEISRRVQVYRKGKPLPSLSNRTVIITDDTIFSGSTMLATIDFCKKQEAGKIIAAVPACNNDVIQTLIPKIDDVVVLKTPAPFHHVSQAYESFPAISDQQIIKLLKIWQARTNLLNALKHAL